MTVFIHVEPAHRHRPAFAAWGLTQTPPLQTATAQGWDVPIDLYPLVPTELLEGAYVDGYPYGRPQAQPVPAEEPKASTFTTADTLTQDPDAGPKPVLTAEKTAAPAPAPAPAPRKRAAKKTAAKRGQGAYTRKPTDAEREAMTFSSGTEGDNP